MNEISNLIESSDLSENKKRGWRRRKDIPLQVLRLLFGRGFLPSSPKKGMGYDSFLDWLFEGPFKDSDNQESCRYLYEKLVIGESIPVLTRDKKEFFMKSENGQLISRSQARDLNPSSLF